MSEPKPLATLSSSLLARKGHAKPAMRPQGFGTFGNSFGGHDDLGWNDMGHDRPHAVAVGPFSKPVVAPIPPVVLQREELAEELNGFAHTAAPIEDALELPPVEEVDEDFAAAYEECGGEPDVTALNGEPLDLLEDEAVEDEAAELVEAEPVAAVTAEPVFEAAQAEHNLVETPVEADAPEAIEAPTRVETPAVVARVRPVAVARAQAAAKDRKSKAAFTLRLDGERHLRLRLACAVTNESAQAIVTAALDQYLNSFPELDDLARIAPAKI